MTRAKIKAYLQESVDEGRNWPYLYARMGSDLKAFARHMQSNDFPRMKLDTIYTTIKEFYDDHYDN